MSLTEMVTKIKGFPSTRPPSFSGSLHIGIILCVGFGAFFLGFSAGEHEGRGKAQMQENLKEESSPDFSLRNQETQALGVSQGSMEHKLVASKKGTKYHLLSCPGAKTIQEENKIYFSSVNEARAAGFLPAGNCPGLLK